MADLKEYKDAVRSVYDKAYLNVMASTAAGPEQGSFKLVEAYNTYVQQYDGTDLAKISFDKWLAENSNAKHVADNIAESDREEAKRLASKYIKDDKDIDKAWADLKGDAKGFLGSNMLPLIGMAVPILLGMTGMIGEGMGMLTHLLMGVVAFLAIGAFTDSNSVGGQLLGKITGSGEKAKDDGDKTTNQPSADKAADVSAAKKLTPAEKAKGEADLVNGVSNIDVSQKPGSKDVTMVVSSKNQPEVARTFMGIINESGTLVINQIMQIPDEGKSPQPARLKKPVTIPGVGNDANPSIVDPSKLLDKSNISKIDTLVINVAKDTRDTIEDKLDVSPARPSINIPRQPAGQPAPSRGAH